MAPEGEGPEPFHTDRQLQELLTEVEQAEPLEVQEAAGGTEIAMVVNGGSVADKVRAAALAKTHRSGGDWREGPFTGRSAGCSRIRMRS